MGIAKSISFERLDRISSHIEEISKEFADHFKSRRPYVSEYCSLIRLSRRWEIENLEEKLSEWISKNEKRPGFSRLVDIVGRAFRGCTSTKEINSLRGAMVEAILIGCFGGSKNLNNPNYGWGARVDVISPDAPVDKIVYRCTIHETEDCSNRSTVDFGFWNGKHGKFFECKVRPNSIGCKEVMYMQYLKTRLNSHDISNEMFFVCADPSEAVKMQLEEWGLSPVYKAIGIKELTEMVPAS